jgi:endonuclease/exonuclease/phosphatase family metal-dependent hydrolase
MYQMKYIRQALAILVLLISSQLTLFAQTDTDLWINEIHYDNVGSDTGEFIEIVVQANFTDLDGIGITLYNGSPTGSLGSYGSFSFSDLKKGETEGSITVYYLDLPSNGIQNGSPDGLRLDVNGSLVQFLSYEGTFTASDGPAQGVTSTDIGVEQTGAEAGSSISLSGTGTGYSDFQWANTNTNSKGSVNQNQTIEATASNIDEPTIQVFAFGAEVSNNDILSFDPTLVDNSSEALIEIKNLGNDTLVISEVSITGNSFSVSDLVDSSLAFNEISRLTVTFSPESPGQFSEQNGFQIINNGVNEAQFTLSLAGEGISSTDYIPIADARNLTEGSIVNIAGVVTVTDEFAGPMYFQDETAGIAWFYSPMRDETQTFFANVSRGDSIYITGELGSFNELIQIVGDTPEFEFRPNQNELTPTPITVTQLNTGTYEGQLVSLEVEIDHTGALQGNTNYDISDQSGTGVMRISSFTDIVGSTAPSGTTTIVGVVGNFRGTFQLTPRDLEDINAEINVIPGEEVPRDETFDVVTWNIEWFGSAANNPEDDMLQFENVKTVITTIDADVYALQEISNESLFNDLVNDLTEYDGIFADFSQTQNTAYLYKTETIQRRNSRLITTGMIQSDWANGRYPLYFQFNATINEEVREINMFNIHAKAFGEQTDYNQRLNASNQMKTYLDNNHADDNVIFLGDFNDEILGSTVGSNDSPYKNFDDDTEYSIVTKSLEESGFTSFSSSSMIDHIVFTSELSDEYFVGTERVENTSYVGSYLSTTSDHFPVWVRFMWGSDVSNEEEITESPVEFGLDQNYPNPFNPSTQISYQLAQSGLVTLTVYDALGREVAVLVDGVKSAGNHQVTFDAASLSSGIYIYQLRSQAGSITKKMLLVK